MILQQIYMKKIKVFMKILEEEVIDDCSKLYIDTFRIL